MSRKTSIVLIAGDEASSTIATQLQLNWDNLLTRIQDSIKKIRESVSFLRPTFQVSFEKHLRVISDPGNTVISLINPLNKKAAALDLFQFRIVIGGNATQILRNRILSKTEKKQLASLSLITLVELLEENEPEVELFEPPRGAALALRSRWNERAVFDLLHDLAVEIFCCGFFTGGFIKTDGHKQRSILARFAQEKLNFAQQRNLAIYGANVLPAGTAYFPFSLAIRNNNNELDLVRYIETWKAFQAVVIQNTAVHDEPITHVQNEDQVIDSINSDYRFDQLRGLLPISEIKETARRCFQSYGIGDFVLLVAMKAPERRSDRKAIVLRLIGREEEWRQYRVSFQRFHRDGYGALRKYVEVFRFRLA